MGAGVPGGRDDDGGGGGDGDGDGVTSGAAFACWEDYRSLWPGGEGLRGEREAATLSCGALPLLR